MVKALQHNSTFRSFAHHRAAGPGWAYYFKKNMSKGEARACREAPQYVHSSSYFCRQKEKQPTQLLCASRGRRLLVWVTITTAVLRQRTCPRCCDGSAMSIPNQDCRTYCRNLKIVTERAKAVIPSFCCLQFHGSLLWGGSGPRSWSD